MNNFSFNGFRSVAHKKPFFLLICQLKSKKAVERRMGQIIRPIIKIYYDEFHDLRI